MGFLRMLADGLIHLSAAIGAVAIVAEIGIILVDVIGRALGAPLFGSQDMITMIMVLVVFGGMALCDRTGGHIVVDLFESKFSRAFNRWIDILSALLGAVVFGFIAWAVWESAALSEMLNLSTNLLRWPKAWFQWALCGFAVITAFGMVLRALELAISGRDLRKESAPV